MRVRVTDDAKADLRHIKAFISDRNAIAGVIDRIRKTLTLLAVLPRLGHPGLVHGTVEKGVARVPSWMSTFGASRSRKTCGELGTSSDRSFK